MTSQSQCNDAPWRANEILTDVIRTIQPQVWFPPYLEPTDIRSRLAHHSIDRPNRKSKKIFAIYYHLPACWPSHCAIRITVDCICCSRCAADSCFLYVCLCFCVFLCVCVVIMEFYTRKTSHGFAYSALVPTNKGGVYTKRKRASKFGPYKFHPPKPSKAKNQRLEQLGWLTFFSFCWSR